jgi:CO/xanthine dehydrogenase Mo-binding subunit
MSRTISPDLDRRQLLQGGGMLLVGLSLGACVTVNSTARAVHPLRNPLPGPPDATEVDTWLAIHADNTATLYMGFAELGQGATTALLQVAA